MSDIHDVPDGEVVEVAGAGPAPATNGAVTADPGSSGDDEVVDAEVVDGDEDEDGAAGAGDDRGDGDDQAAATDPLTLVTAQRDEYLDSLRRLQAEFENYRKRVAKQQAEQVERAAISLVDKVLPVLDALDLAAAHLGDAESDDARALVAASGLLNDVLAKEGLERIDPAGEGFDPNAHEAVGHLPDEEGDEEDQGDEGDQGNGDGRGSVPDGPVVAQVMRPGYRWRGTVVRPAMVMVRG